MTLMLSREEASVLKRLYDAFYDVPKPEPLADLKSSYCDEEVEVFYALNWEAVTFKDYMAGHEGWIVSEPETVAYLLPRLFRMIFQEHPINKAIHNVTSEISFRLLSGHQREEISAVLSLEQKLSVVAAFKFMDTEYFDDPGTCTASNVAAAFGL